MSVFMAFCALERMAYLSLPRSLESMGGVADGEPVRGTRISLTLWRTRGLLNTGRTVHLAADNSSGQAIG